MEKCFLFPLASRFASSTCEKIARRRKPDETRKVIFRPRGRKGLGGSAFKVLPFPETIVQDNDDREEGENAIIREGHRLAFRAQIAEERSKGLASAFTFSAFSSHARRFGYVPGTSTACIVARETITRTQVIYLSPSLLYRDRFRLAVVAENDDANGVLLPLDTGDLR